MAKRNAASELTDRNWDQEEESEEAGVFVAAEEDILKKRQFKTAKRRAPSDDNSGGAFKGFVGFGAKPASSSPAAPAFSFGTKGLPGLGASSNGDKPAASGGFIFGSAASKALVKTEADSSKPAAGEFKFTNATSSDAKTTTSATTAPAFSFTNAGSGFKFGVKPTESKDSTKSLTSNITFGSIAKSSDTKDSPKKNGGSSSNPKYLAQLKGLNEQVAKWIKDHVDKNPYILLTPIFKDYETYLEKLEKEHPEGKEEGQPAADEKKEVSSSFTFGSIKAKTESSPDTKKDDSAPKSSPPKASGFTFGSGTATSALGSGFSFKSSRTTTSTTSGFSFKPCESSGGSAAPFSFATGGSAPPAATAAPSADGDEEYVPPKPESVEIKEDDALYTKRCKLFFQKDGSYVERGVGNLHLKPLNDKTQLLIRADNTLGTVLLNIVLSSAIPMKRQGKNNVSLICTPNPPIDTMVEDNKAASLLIRVKTGEDADELLAQLDKHKS